MLTRKHYKVIAGVISDTLADMPDTPEARYALGILVAKFCKVLKADNSKFDSGRFMKACEWKEATNE